MTLERLFKERQFSLPQEEKEQLLLQELEDLCQWHRHRCLDYKKILDARGYKKASSLEALPYLPVSLFKSHILKSIADDEIFKIMTSSGTTGQSVSRVLLDRTTAELQSNALKTVMQSVLGRRRMPMIIVDSPNVVKDRAMFSARGAGILGLLPFGRKHIYVLDDDMNLDVTRLLAYLKEYEDEPVLIFGFTFMVWKYLLQSLQDQDIEVDLSRAVLIHSGGWKKLHDEQVTNREFRQRFRETLKLERIHNFYGMVEQVGSVFLEGPDGYLYPPNYSDVIIRNPLDWSPQPLGVPGVVEVMSVLPRSYPGHVLLTEDLGIVHGVGTPESNWSGKQLEIIGRIPASTLRGCSDTHAEVVNRA